MRTDGKVSVLVDVVSRGALRQCLRTVFVYIIHLRARHQVTESLNWDLATIHF